MGLVNSAGHHCTPWEAFPVVRASTAADEKKGSPWVIPPKSSTDESLWLCSKTSLPVLCSEVGLSEGEQVTGALTSSCIHELTI